jgi:protein-S-isoprenylcysteine O-methyltransferase Ste14
VILAAGVVLAVFGTPWLVQGGGPDLLLQAAGWMVFLCGAFLRMWAFLYIGGRKGKIVMENGPYAMLRHPLYVGSFLIVLSTALFLDSLVLLIALILTVPAYHLFVIPREEARLRDRFGIAYTKYCKRTNRYLPRIRAKSARPRVLEVDMAAVATECSRAFWWAALPLFCALVTWLRVQQWWPHFSPLP